jgi:hypothetical protein
MRGLWLALIFLGLLSGCGGGIVVSAVSSDLSIAETSLWTVRLGRGDQEIFAGLLALRNEGDSIRAVLLDSTGIKLLEERISSSGEVQVIKAIPAVRDKRLPSFLGEGLYRLFFNSEGFAGELCRRDGFASLCFGEQDSGQLVKLRRFGPFVLWRADYFINNYGSRSVISGARLNSFWPAPYLDLQRRVVGDPAGESDGNDR